MIARDLGKMALGDLEGGLCILEAHLQAIGIAEPCPATSSEPGKPCRLNTSLERCQAFDRESGDFDTALAVVATFLTGSLEQKLEKGDRTGTEPLARNRALQFPRMALDGEPKLF